jgi:glycerophosphoryl diester phosphodiesterase
MPGAGSTRISPVSLLPTLAEMLDCARDWGKGIYIEIKHADHIAVLREVQRAGMVAQCFFWGWDYDGLRAIKAAEPKAKIMTRRMDFDRLEDCFANLSPDIIEYDSTDDWSDMVEARGYGAELMICYMGRDPEVFDRVIDARPDIAKHRRPFHLPAQNGGSGPRHAWALISQPDRRPPSTSHARRGSLARL